MPMQNPERAIAYLTGEVHALFMISQAVARTHPAPQALLSDLETAAQLGLANIEPHPVPDATIEGYQHVIGGVRNILQGRGAIPPYSSDADRPS